MLIKKDNPLYQKACRRESLFWSQDLFGTQSSQITPKLLKEYQNNHYSGEKNIDFNAYVKSLGSFKKWLSIGGGFWQGELSLVKDGIIDYLEFLDISEGSNKILASNAKKLNIQDQVHIKVGDLNFLELQDNLYDVIICKNVLHHIINLEECLFELNKSLKKDWIIIIDEFIGAKKFQRSDVRINLIHTFQSYLKEKYDISTKKFDRTNPRVLTNNCPFESIRSHELYSIISHYRGKSIVREALGGYIMEDVAHYIINYDEKIILTALKFEKIVEENNLFPAPRLFGVYRKSQGEKLVSYLWSEEEIKKNIGITIISERKVMYIADIIQKKLPRIYSSLKRIYFILRK